MRVLKLWIQGARLRTLPLSIGPVLLGASLAQSNGSFRVLLFILACLVAIFLQIGVNFANDYSDGVRGTDDFRVGPRRLTSSGLVDSSLVKQAAIAAFLFAVACGIIIVLVCGNWWLVLVGLLSLGAAWFYTGGAKPYGYSGFGEVSAFIFFGLVPTLGTAFIMIGKIPAESWLAGATVGFFAAAALLVNNIRDEATDREAKKKTLAVRFGRNWSMGLLGILLMLPYAILGALFLSFPNSWLVGFLSPLTVAIIAISRKSTSPQQLVVCLGLITLNAILFAVALSSAIIL